MNLEKIKGEGFFHKIISSADNLMMASGDLFSRCSEFHGGDTQLNKNNLMGDSRVCKRAKRIQRGNNSLGSIHCWL